MFLTTVLERLEEKSWNLVTFNINLRSSIKKSYFWFPRLSGVTKQRVRQGVSTQDFLKLLFQMFPYNKILQVFKSKIWLNIWNKHLKILLNTKFQSNEWRGFGRYEHPKFRPTHRLKYRLWRHNYVMVMMSQTFLLPLCRIHRALYLC